MWLFDISYWSTPSNAVNAIAESPLKLSDDLYLYKIQQEKNNNNMSIELWEHYQIHEKIPKKLVRYGTWTANQGLNLGRVALLSHFHKVLALSKFTLLKCEIEVNPIAWIPRRSALRNFSLHSAGGPGNPCYGVHFILAL